MRKKLVHTPEGVRDIYGTEYARKLTVEAIIQEKIRSYGYEDIQTPTFEYFDIFSRDIGTTPSRELYKFYDKEGETLVLRPDFTPSMARCAAKYFMEENIPIRFCYLGNTFINTSNLQGKLKEVTQMGAELIGDSSPEADAEVAALIIETLLQTGLRDFQLSIGTVDYFKGLCSEAGLEEETVLKLRDYIAGKNYFAAEELLLGCKVPEAKREKLLRVTDLFGSRETLNHAREMAQNPCSVEAIDRLCRLHDLLCEYGVEKYVSFDLGLLSKYDYYTGVIFKAYTYGVGDAVVTGGRYDNLLSQFGKDAPAIGFMIVVDDLLNAMSRQNISVAIPEAPLMLTYQPEEFREALKKAMKLRAEGKKVSLIRAES